VTYLIDGTNAVRRLYQESHRVSMREEEEHMDSFVEWVGWMAARHKKAFRVAFDGPPRSFAGASGVQVLFGKEAGADAVLLDQVRYLVHSGETVTLVTADRALADEAEREGASTILPEAFFKKFRGGPLR
jgi:hypothetical protein